MSAAALSRGDVEGLLTSANLLEIGQRADEARRARHGDRSTYVTVFEIRVDAEDPRTHEIPEGAREVRLVGRPRTVDEAEASVVGAKAIAGDRALTGFSLADLVGLASESHSTLSDIASRLSSAGLESLAEVPIDMIVDPVRAVGDVVSNGLGAWRVVVYRAGWDDRLGLIERLGELQRSTGAVKAFAPLPRIEDRAAPSTGFDDVRTIAAARLMADVAHIQVDWPLYGPKLAQVALTYGADDIDGVSAVDALGLGWRRAPVEDVERNIRAAGREPALRSGRFTIT
ncbi:MAG TPA: hypothetical protein VFZ36_05155 [Vicinamibacterales bacterium]